MNLSLRNRVVISFVIANVAVLVLTAIVFNYLNSLNKDIESFTEKSNRINVQTDEIRISAVTLLKRQRELLSSGGNQELVAKIVSLCESFKGQLHMLESMYQQHPDVKTSVAQMVSYVESLNLVLNKAAIYGRDNAGMASVGELADKILDAFSDLQDIQFDQAKKRVEDINKIIAETKRNMMITLIIAFLATILIGLVIPGKIALPFKKIKDAIRELQDCNFDVSIYYNQDDEIGEIAREMNKMIKNIKIFDELRTDRIGVERRKFDALANMVKKPVLIANANGHLIYMNSKMYSILLVQSEEVINKNMSETSLPSGIIESFELAIKRRSKIDNTEVVIMKKREVEEDETGVASYEPAINESGETIDEARKEEEVAFSGFATVVPIRGKESSLDYYLMVLSTEVFT